MQETSLKYTFLNEDNISGFWEVIDALGFSHNRDLYEVCLERQKDKDLNVVLAWNGAVCAGFAILNFMPKYALFLKLGIPEIQDLNVLRDQRRQGIGEGIINFCEKEVYRKNYEYIGISVGLDHTFGAAQRLYARLGYIPDGAGVTYDRIQVTPGEFRPIDGNLCLMMTKCLKN